MLSEGTLALAGFNYSYRANIEGGRECILVLGGSLQSMDAWAGYLPRYHEHFDTILTDLPGMGDSDVLPSHYPVEYLADCLKRVLDAAGVSRVHLQASSYGAVIANVFACKYAENVSRVVFIGPVYKMSPALHTETRVCMAHMWEGDLESAASAFEKLYTCTERVGEIEKGVVARKLLGKSVRRLTWPRRAAYVQNMLRILDTKHVSYSPFPGVSCLVTTGRYDTYATPEQCREVAGALPMAQFILVDRADHLVHIERSEVVGELCCRFFAGETIADTPGCVGYETFPAK